MLNIIVCLIISLDYHICQWNEGDTLEQFLTLLLHESIRRAFMLSSDQSNIGI